jgi:outer membrane lipoprotein-sorting protein
MKIFCNILNLETHHCEPASPAGRTFSAEAIFRRFTFLLIFFLLITSIKSQTYKPVRDTTALKKQIEEMSASINTIESDFTQEKNLSVLSEKVNSKGHFIFKKENMLKWEYSVPYKYLIVINKNNIWIKDDKKTSKYDMNSNKVFKEINDIMLSCVQGTIFKTGKFKVAYFENEKFYKLELVPLQKNMKESLKKINMYFDKNVTSVSKLDMIEPNEDYTTLEFINKKLNGPVADNIFTAK